MASRDILSSFYANVCSYFCGNCSTGKCYLVRKHKMNLKVDGDFSITLNIEAHRKHANVKSTNDMDVKLCQCYMTEESCELLSQMSNVDKQKLGKMLHSKVEFSEKWPLKVAKCSINHERLCLYLNRVDTFQTVLHCILSQNTQYGKLQNLAKKILLTSDISLEDEWMMNMTDYRIYLVRGVLNNLLTEFGHSVILNADSHISVDDHMHCHVTTNRPANSSCNVLIHCGAIIDAGKKHKEINILSKDYLRQRCEELKAMSRHKHGDHVNDDRNWETFFRKIGEATLRIDLLSARPSRLVTLNLKCQETSRNAHFILYNCARLAVLQEKFNKKCEKTYPSIIPLDEIDFSLLAKEEEWELLAGYLLMYPQVLQSTIELLDKGKPMPNLLCQFLYSLCGCYSSYYRRVRVLTEPRDHLLPVMFARLYLLRAVECVLHNGLRLLGIEPVRYM